MLSQVISFTLILLTALAFPLRAQSVLSGTVNNEAGKPVPGATVIIKSLKRGTITDVTGRFSVQGTFSGEQTVEVSSVGYAPVRQTVDFGAGATHMLNIILAEAVEQLNDVLIEGQTEEQEVKQRAYTVDVIETQALYNTGTDLNQVLDRTAGVRVREDGGLGSSFSFSLNGFSGKQVRFYLDGIPMDNFGSSLTPNNFPVNLAQRVEIYKGVVPISLGTDALGGAVNIISRAAPGYLDVSYGYGSFNTHRASVHAAHTTPSGITVRTMTFYNYSDNNYRVGVRPIDLESGQRLPTQEVERFHDQYRSAAARVEVGVTARPYADQLLVGLIASGNEQDIQNGVIMDQVFGARTARTHSLIPTLRYNKDNLLADGLDLSLYAAYNHTRNQFVDTTRLRYNWLQDTESTTTAELRRTQLENRDREALLTSNITYTLSDYSRVSANYLLTDFQRSSDDAEDPDNVTFLFPQRLRKQVLGLAWQTEYDRFTATLFSKLYHLTAASFEDVSGGAGETNYQISGANSRNVGYGAAATFFVLPTGQVKASYEHTYRLPEAVELLGDGLFTRRNADLSAEQSDNVNLGIRYATNPKKTHRFDVGVNYLLRLSEDYIRLDQAQTQPVDRQFVNVGRVRTNGFEGDVGYRWQHRLRANANVTYQRIVDRQRTLSSTNLTGTTVSRNLNFGFRIPNIPYLFGNATIDYSLLKNPAGDYPLTVGYRLHYVQEYFLTPNQLGSNNSDNIPTQWAHNLTVSYTAFGERLNITGELRNLTDAALFDNYRLQKPGRSFFINLRYFLDQSLF